jgi:hypothetical protein
MASDEVTVYLPPIEEVVRRWSEIEPVLARATTRTGCYEPIDLLMMAANGKAGLWLCKHGDEIDAALVTQVVIYPRRRILEVIFGGGNNLKRWVETAVEAIDQHASELGCSHVACVGRSGWVRAWGAHPTGDIIMVRELRS